MRSLFWKLRRESIPVTASRIAESRSVGVYAIRAWLEAVKRSGLADFRLHDLPHTWASWHRQAGTSCDLFLTLSHGAAGPPARARPGFSRTPFPISRGRRTNPIPASPRPSSARVTGSGTVTVGVVTTTP